MRHLVSDDREASVRDLWDCLERVAPSWCVGRWASYGEVTRWGTPMFGIVTALEGLYATERYRNRSMQHTCSRHATWDPHRNPVQERAATGGRRGVARVGVGLPKPCTPNLFTNLEIVNPKPLPDPQPETMGR